MNKKLTQQIMNLTAPYNNQYQGNDLRLLFVCSVGLLRSPTAADIATKLGCNTRSCGSSSVALIALSVNLIAWADFIVFVNEENKQQAYWNFMDSSWYDTLVDKTKVLNIEDDYERNDPELIRLLTLQIERIIDWNKEIND